MGGSLNGLSFELKRISGGQARSARELKKSMDERCFGAENLVEVGGRKLCSRSRSESGVVGNVGSRHSGQRLLEYLGPVLGPICWASPEK